MLGNSTATSTFSVRDIAEARTFYGDVLGIKVTEEYGGRILRLHIAGGMEVTLYAKEDHAPASFTVLTFTVDDLGELVDALTGRGVTFERPTGLELDDKGVHHAPGHYAAWFTDPSGNTLSLTQVTEA